MRNLTKPTSEPRSGFYSERFDIYIACFRKLAPTDAEKREELEPEKRHANRGRILAFQRSDFPHFSPTLFRQLSLSLTLPFSSSSFSIEAPSKASTFGHHFCPKSRNEGIFGVVKCVATSGTSKIQQDFAQVQKNAMYLLVVERLVLFEYCFAWMLWKLGRIDGDPVLRETRIWATWEYVSLVGEWYLEICRGGQETLGTSGGVLLPKTKLDQSRPNPSIVGLKNEVRELREPLIVMAAQLIHDRVEMECLEGAWETLEGNRRCRFWGTIRFTATSLVHPDEPARTLQRTVEWTAFFGFVLYYFLGWVYLGLTVRFTLLFLYG
ncbi:hypothetical protein HKD37_U058107 [Glycine soja]